ncbi:MAG: hypothetical protein LLF83_04920 [Methanobacterium sp.]|nr:hypothetical protein [Methanobacterium sp.]
MNIKIVEREILNPLADTDTIKLELNPLPQNRRFIALLDNTKPNADLILNLIQENLEFDKFIRITKPAGDSATSDQIEQTAQADLIILALGDCGSCTTWLILDAIKLEKQGMPTISICSHIFAPFARELAESYGAHSLKIIEIEHPLAGQSKEVIKTKTQKIISQMNEMLD